MKVAYIVTSLANKGPIIVVHDLVNGMMSHGHDCFVFYFKKEEGLEFNCPTIKIGYSSSFDFSSFDVVHCHGLQPDLFIMLRKPLFCKTPILTTLHSYLFDDHYFQYGKWLYKFTASLVLMSTIRDDKIITLSKHAMNYYAKYLPKTKLDYAYNTRICNKSLLVEKSLQDEILNFKGKSILIGTTCVISERKNLNAIIEALAFLENCKFCIVGDGPEKETLVKLAIKNGVQDRVLFLGCHSNAYRFLPLFDIFTIPSKSEGFPLAMLEAAIFKKAILASNLPVFEEIFNSEEIVTFDLKESGSIVPAIIKAIEGMTEYGRKANERYKKHYAIDSFVKRHIGIYQQCIKNREIGKK